MLSDLFLWWKYRGKCHRHLRELIKIPLKKEDIVIDCGANVGEITAILARHGSKVFAFEPNPYAYSVLKEKFANNSNVECIQCGIHHVNGTVRLYFHELAKDDHVLWSTGSSILEFKSNVSKQNFIEIEVIDFCEFIDGLGGRIKLIKMDVEGAECGILKKMIDTEIIYKIDHMFLERHEHKIPELKNEMEKIEQVLSEKNIRNVYLNWI